jgi:AmiR/NasT family two-component response regulator
MRRVLIGEFGDIPAMALRRVLEDEGVALAGEATAAETVALVGELRPDVLILDHDHAATEGIAAEVSERHPGLVVIAWSAAEPLMRVFPARSGGESEVGPLTIERLATVLKGVRSGPTSLVGLTALSPRSRPNGPSGGRPPRLR